MKKHFKLTCLFISFAISALMVGVFIWTSTGSFLSLMDKKWVDFIIQERSERPISPAVVIAAVDTKSVDKYGRWPWPRTRMAELVEALNEYYRVATIGFDMVFSEPSHIDPYGDARLAKTIEETPNTVLGYFFYTNPADVQHLSEERVAESERRIARFAAPMTGLIDPDLIPLGLVVESNIAEISGGGVLAGYFNIQLDIEDGFMRRAHLLMRHRGGLYASLDLQIMRHYYGNQPTRILADEETGVLMGIEIGPDKFIPTAFDGSIMLNFKGPARTFPHYSIYDIIERAIPKEALQGKIVLIGATEVGIGDFLNTPAGSLHGVEIHATAIDNVLTETYFSITAANDLVTVAVMLLVGLLLGIVLPKLKLLYGSVITVVLMVAYTFLHRWMVMELLSWTSYVYVILVLPAVWVAVTIYRGQIAKL